ncbi:MAG TPA: hypothetical protein PLE30_00030 [Candidatus Kapabacteria bacterium]|nr:hypothetical protein [Candidatus Kapabacteria bacterium]
MNRYRKGEVFASDTCEISQMLLTDVEWQYRYNPFGDHTSTSLSAGGVRKYDYEIGRFTSVDPLWEKYTGWTGYQYSGNKIKIIIKHLFI